MKVKVLVVDDDSRRFNYLKNALMNNEITSTKDPIFKDADIYESDNYVQMIASLAKANIVDLYFYIFKIIEDKDIDIVFMDMHLKGKEKGKTSGETLIGMILGNELHKKLPIIAYSRIISSESKLHDPIKLLGEGVRFIPVDSTSSASDIRGAIAGNIKTETFVGLIRKYRNREFNYNLSIITALDKEYRSVKNLIDKREWISVNRGYKKAYWENKKNKVILKVMLTSMNNNMGMVVATMRTLDLINLTKPVLVAMTGIAGGSKKNGARLGDICVAKTIDNWQSGKYESGGTFELSPEIIEINQTLKTIIETDYIQDNKQKTVIGKIINDFTKDKVNSLIDLEIKNENEYLKNELKKEQEKEVYKKTIREKERLPEFKFADMLTGSSLVADERVIDKGMHARNRKAFFFDMEGYAVARVSHTKLRKWLVIKAIVDYGNLLKGDAWHEFASFASAKFLYELSFDILRENEQP